jgi:acetyltransferase-like isoleucine patch superfamily enzyme
VATIDGNGISRPFAFLYSALLSTVTGATAARWRTRALRSKFERFGRGSSVSFGTRILDPGNIRVGSRSTIPNTSVIDGRGGLTIGNDCLLGFENVILTSTHASDRVDLPMLDQGMYEAPVSIGDDVWTGCRVVILPGVRIGSHAIIGAGAVVTNDIPDWAVAAGVPARVLRDRRDGAMIDARDALDATELEQSTKAPWMLRGNVVR